MRHARFGRGRVAGWCPQSHHTVPVDIAGEHVISARSDLTIIMTIKRKP